MRPSSFVPGLQRSVSLFLLLGLLLLFAFLTFIVIVIGCRLVDGREGVNHGLQPKGSGTHT